MIQSVSTPRVLTVAYAADRTVRLPLRVSAFTLLQNVAPDAIVHFHVFEAGWTPKDAGRLRRTLDRAGRPYRLTVRRADVGRYLGLEPLRTSHLTYARLDLPHQLDAERILYLDTDTLPLCDVSSLFDVDLGGAPLGAVSQGMVAQRSYDSDFYGRLMPPETPVFNSGVLVLDAARYREVRIAERIVALAAAHPGRFRAHDQSLLNGVLCGGFHELHGRYNLQLPRDQPPPAPAASGRREAILHFIGVVKPWAARAPWRHRAYPLWQEASAAAGEPAVALDSHALLRALRNRLKKASRPPVLASA